MGAGSAVIVADPGGGPEVAPAARWTDRNARGGGVERVHVRAEAWDLDLALHHDVRGVAQVEHGHAVAQRPQRARVDDDGAADLPGLDLEDHRAVPEAGELEVVGRAEGRLLGGGAGGDAALDEGAELLELHRLLAHVDVGVPRDLRAVGLEVGRDEEQGDAQPAPAELAEDLEAGAIGQVDVGDDHLRRQGVDVLERGLQRAGLDRADARQLGDPPGHGRAQHRLVFHDEHP